MSRWTLAVRPCPTRPARGAGRHASGPAHPDRSAPLEDPELSPSGPERPERSPVRQPRSPSSRPAVDRYRRPRCGTEGAPQPAVVDPVPFPIGTHLVQPSVDEAYEVDVFLVEPKSIRLLGEGTLIRHHRVRVLGCESGEHRIVTGDRSNLTLLEQ